MAKIIFPILFAGFALVIHDPPHVHDGLEAVLGCDQPIEGDAVDGDHGFHPSNPTSRTLTRSGR